MATIADKQDFQAIM